MVKRFLKPFGIALLLLALGLGVRTFVTRKNNKELPIVAPAAVEPATKTSTVPQFDKTKFSNSDPASLWVVVNKLRPLSPTSYVPNDLVTPNVPVRVPGNETMQLRKVPAVALESLFAAAKTDGLNLMLSSGYRSYSFQTSLYGGYVKNSSVAEADKTSARPGFSEHQTGLSADIEPLSGKCDVDVCFASTPEGIWLAANAYKYGFMIRYTEDKTSITGYNYEPWHIRYIGTELSNELHKQNIKTLEEFFNLGAAPNYSS